MGPIQFTESSDFAIFGKSGIGRTMEANAQIIQWYASSPFQSSPRLSTVGILDLGHCHGIVRGVARCFTPLPKEKHG